MKKVFTAVLFLSMMVVSTHASIKLDILHEENESYHIHGKDVWDRKGWERVNNFMESYKLLPASKVDILVHLDSITEVIESSNSDRDIQVLEFSLIDGERPYYTTTGYTEHRNTRHVFIPAQISINSDGAILECNRLAIRFGNNERPDPDRLRGVYLDDCDKPSDPPWKPFFQFRYIDNTDFSIQDYPRMVSCLPRLVDPNWRGPTALAPFSRQDETSGC